MMLIVAGLPTLQNALQEVGLFRHQSRRDGSLSVSIGECDLGKLGNRSMEEVAFLPVPLFPFVQATASR